MQWSIDRAPWPRKGLDREKMSKPKDQYGIDQTRPDFDFGGTYTIKTITENQYGVQT